ncbi:hypothetical protein QE152_g32177 [Popillia japonica]|uniref:Uncharacterized protein n=1 Tax=Popillia japonica TaxID=7064 RepID=A0AAW1J0H5_POPJA
MQFYVKKKRKRMEILFRIKWSSARERGAHPPPTRKESWKETAGLTRRRRGGGRTRGREGPTRRRLERKAGKRRPD